MAANAMVVPLAYAPGETGSYRFSVAPSMGTARQAAVQGLGKTPCYVPLQGSFFTPEASVRKR